jgi:hypothetical protein
MHENTQFIRGPTLSSISRDGTIEDFAGEADRINNVGIAQAYYPDPSLITHPVVLVFGNSSTQIVVALINNGICLRHDDPPPA